MLSFEIPNVYGYDSTTRRMICQRYQVGRREPEADVMMSISWEGNTSVNPILADFDTADNITHYLTSSLSC